MQCRNTPAGGREGTVRTLWMGFGVRPASALGQLAAAFLKRGLPQAVGFAGVTETAREPSRSGSSHCHGILSLSDLDLIPSASRVTGSPGEQPLRPSRTAAVAMTGIQCFQTIRVHHHEFLQGRGMTGISPVRQGSGAGEGGAPRGVLGCIVPLPFWLRHPWPRPLPVFNASGVTSSNLPLPPPLPLASSLPRKDLVVPSSPHGESGGLSPPRRP